MSTLARLFPVSLASTALISTVLACRSADPPDSRLESDPATAPASGASDKALKAAHESPLPEQLLSRPLRARMQEVDERFFTLEAAVQAGDAPGARTELPDLVMLFRSAKESREEAGFDEMADKMLVTLDELAQALEGDDVELQQASLATVSGRCDACHAIYRKK
ncbi:MAG: hypothetical protein AB1486_05980 [Planctomycetota bacterium]